MEKQKSKKSKKSVPLVHVSRGEKQKMLRPRRGYETIARRLIAIVQSDRYKVSIPDLDPDQIESDIAAAEAAHALVGPAMDQLAMATSTELLHSSSVWRQAIRMYRYLKVAAQDDPSLAADLVAIEAFMKTRRASAKPAPSAPSTPTAA